MQTRQRTKTAQPGRAIEVFLAFLWLGLTSFGGPLAHLGYFRRAFVQRRQWLNEDEYAELVALCQFLPGPASSQTGFLIGLRRAGGWGAAAACLGFTLPSAILMIVCAVVAPQLTGSLAWGAIHGLKLAAVAVVAQAVYGMAGRLCTDRRRVAIALAAFVIILLVQSPFIQLAAILCGAVAGLLLCRPAGIAPSRAVHPPVGKGLAIAAGFIFLAFLIALPMAARLSPDHSAWRLADVFYRTGSLVFGGGHVVLPLLRNALVPEGWIGEDRFLAGYGAAQALPGPLFAYAAYLGGTVSPNWGLAPTALMALVMIFLPGLLLVLAIYPFWTQLQQNMSARAGLAGINAAVVGVLGAALYDPVWLSTISKPVDVVFAIIGFLLLEKWQTPPLIVVLSCVGGGILMAM